MLRHALAEILRRGDHYAAELAPYNLTITEVSISPDLKNATVYLTPLGGAEAGAALKAIQKLAVPLRHSLAQKVQLKFAPQLRFMLDERLDYAAKMDNLFSDPAVARDLEPKA